MCAICLEKLTLPTSYDARAHTECALPAARVDATCRRAASTTWQCCEVCYAHAPTVPIHRDDVLKPSPDADEDTLHFIALIHENAPGILTVELLLLCAS